MSRSNNKRRRLAKWRKALKRKPRQAKVRAEARRRKLEASKDDNAE